MPIDRRQFELGINSEKGDWMGKIYKFLVENKQTAYTWEELADSLEINWRLAEEAKYGWGVGPEHEKAVDTKSLFNDALERLIGLDCVEAREVRGAHYFAKGRRDLKQVLAREVLPF